MRAYAFREVEQLELFGSRRLIPDHCRRPGTWRMLSGRVWNAGAWGLIQLGITLGPPGLGSGKLGTPCERMH